MYIDIIQRLFYHNMSLININAHDICTTRYRPPDMNMSYHEINKFKRTRAKPTSDIIKYYQRSFFLV